MIKRIQKLPMELANHIAAGEVVERPSSVLKELLENSLDAQSKNIQIYIEGGGIQSIRVEDDGHGICKEDLELAIVQHATSKVFSLSDLEGIESYGFRGEALASISAVSEFKIISAVEKSEMGWGLILNDQIKRTQQKNKESQAAYSIPLFPQPKRVGTTVEVRRLFYNTPARRQFLKSERTEFLHLEEIFKRIALSTPEVSFSLYQDQKLIKRLPAVSGFSASENRLTKLCGEKFSQNAQYFEAESNGLSLKGWLGSVDQQRAQPDLQYFYLNGRIVRDKVINHAVREGFRDFNLLGRFPSFILHFFCDPKNVDVNVHPTKHEVRFRDVKTIHHFISYAIGEALKGIDQKHKTLFVDRYDNGDDQKGKVEIVESEAGERQYATIKKINPHKVSNQNEFIFGKAVSIIGDQLLFSERESDCSKNIFIFNIKRCQYYLTSKKLMEQYENGSIKMRKLFMPKRIIVDEKMINLLLQSNEPSNSTLDQTLVNWGKLGFDFSIGGQDKMIIRGIPELIKMDKTNEKNDNELSTDKDNDLLEHFIKNLLKMKTSELCIEYITQFVVQHWTLSMIDVQEFLIELAMEGAEKREHNEEKLYREIQVEKLTTLLF